MQLDPHPDTASLAGAEEYVEKRYEALRDAIRRHGDAKGAALPLVLAENASRAPTDAAGEKLLGNDKPWRPQAFRQARPLGSTCGTGQKPSPPSRVESVS